MLDGAAAPTRRCGSPHPTVPQPPLDGAAAPTQRGAESRSSSHALTSASYARCPNRPDGPTCDPAPSSQRNRQRGDHSGSVARRRATHFAGSQTITRGSWSAPVTSRSGRTPAGGTLSYGEYAISQPNCSRSCGSPHSSHSLTVSGIDASNIVDTTSTNGTSATTARHRCGCWLMTAPCSSPPALSPREAIRRASTSPSRRSATATWSSNVCCLLPSRPSSHHRRPPSPPPRTWACANTTPRSSRLGSAGSHSGSNTYSYAPYPYTSAGAVPSSGVSRRRTTVTGTAVPSADVADSVSQTYPEASCPGASCARRSVRTPVARSTSDHTRGWT